MSKLVRFFCISVCAFSLPLSADDPSAGLPMMPELLPEMPALQADLIPTPQIIPSPVTMSKPKEKSLTKAQTDAPFSPFTGKVKGKKVRLRLRPDLDSRIIKELNKNDLVSVVGEKGDFWAVEPPMHFKAYVFRGFILDNVVEANHVNVRLEPSLESPIIGHLNAGDRVDAIIAALNNKWCEITVPSGSCFYVAKELVTFAGGPEMKKQMDKRREAGEELLETTTSLAKGELHKPFEHIDFNRVTHSYNTIINDFDEFTDLVEQSSEALAHFQEVYLQKRITHLEKQPQVAEEVATAKKSELLKSFTERMKMWQPIEEALYLSWANFNEERNLQQFYEEQKLAAEKLTGIVESYLTPVKCKPGDFLLRDGDLPIGYLYSTSINLDSLVGKRATLIVAPRPNNNFAFPAYYVLSVE